MLRPGQALHDGRYLLERFLRAGGAGVVWAGRDTRPRRGDAPAVALKAIAAAAGGAEAAAREAEVAARVRHPGVVRVRDTFVADGLAWLVMDLAAGSLADVVARHGPLPPPVALGCALQAAQALAAAHAVGVVHRDVKPHNLLVFPDGSVRLADFGAALALATGHARTRTGALLGSIPFMAPEQRRDARAVRPATDVYALAVTLAWLILGEPPEDLWSPEAAAQLRAAGVPAGLLAVLAAAGARRPEDRPTDGAALHARLLAEGGLAVAGLEPLVAGWSAPPAASAAADGLLPAEPPPPAPRPPVGRAWLLALGLAALAAPAAWWLAQPQPDSPAVAALKEWEAIPLCPDAGRARLWRQYPAQASDPPGLEEAAGAAIADVDLDGHADVVVTHTLGAKTLVWWGPLARDGWFAARSDIPTGRGIGSPAVGDIDGDGFPDIAHVRAEGGGVVVQRMRGREPVGEQLQVEQGAEPSAVAIADWDGDGRGEVFALLRVEDTVVSRRFDGAGFTPPVTVSEGVAAIRGFADGLTLATADGRLRRLTLGGDQGEVPLPRGFRAERIAAGGGEAGVLVIGVAVDGPGAVRVGWDGGVCRGRAVEWVVADQGDLSADGLSEQVVVDSCAYCASSYGLAIDE